MVLTSILMVPFVRELLPAILSVAVVLAIPLLPFLAFGTEIEMWLEDLSNNPPHPAYTAVLMVGLLSTDIFLPIPSSLVSTLGGWQLGIWKATLASWIGMNLGTMIGFELARRWGQTFAKWFSKDADLERMHILSDRLGPIFLVLTRGVPLLAEASVLFVGMHRLSWPRFLLPVLLTNLVLSVIYAAFGKFSEAHGWLPMAVGVSIAVPVLLATLARRWFSTVNTSPNEH